MNDPGSILIIRRRAIGDCIVSMDVARALRERWPAARIAFVVDRPAIDVVQGSAFVDEVLVYDRREFSTGSAWRRLRATLAWFERLRALRPDLVLDLLATPQTALWTAWTRAAIRVGPRMRQRTWAYNVHVEPETQKRFAGERFLDWVRALGIDPGPWRPQPLASVQTVLADVEVADGQRPLVLLNANATWPSKSWPAASFAELGRLLSPRCDVRLAWAPGEEALRDRIVDASGGAVVALPPTTIAGLGAWAARARIVVSTDSGPKHLAVAMGTPTVTLFGSTDPRGWQPPGARHRVLTHPVDCHPCDLLDCPVDGHPCLDDLPAATVAAAVDALLEGRGGHG
jgi:ADP-heptose:LPS heptosyltransferase